MKHAWAILVTGLILLSLSGPAQASNSYSSIDNILFNTGTESFLGKENPLFFNNPNDPLSGFFDFIYLGKEAGHTNRLLQLFQPTGQNQIIFDNQNTPVGTKALNINIANLFLDDLSTGVVTTTYSIINSNTWLKIYKLQSSVTIAGQSLDAGWFLFGFNDDSKSDADYDDLVFAAKAAPVPVPAAVWMLGTAVVGLVGVRRIKTV